jgi:hypothetical protein
MTEKVLLLRDQRTLRTDAWWLAPLATAVALAVFAVYVGWALWQDAGYYAAPYLSPFYSPCLSERCAHVTAPLVGPWWTLPPALLVLWIPLGLRATCYYYRKAYYRSFFLSPAACAVRDAADSYSGESRFPLTLQNLHRYFFYLSVPVLGFIWWDSLQAFRFGGAFGIGGGSLVLLGNAILLTLFAASCNSCRHVCGGHLKSLHEAPVRHRFWRIVSRLNEKHREYAWLSLASVTLADAYIRLLASGAMHDPRFF